MMSEVSANSIGSIVIISATNCHSVDPTPISILLHSLKKATDVKVKDISNSSRA